MAKKRTYDQVKIVNNPSIKSGIKTFDNFISSEGGFELGNMILMTGTSGAGKTTFCKLLQREINQPTHFHALESLASSVKKQTRRIKIGHGNAYITDEKDYEDFDKFMEFLYEDKPLFVMVDSLQHAVDQLVKKGMGETAAFLHVRTSLYNWKDETQGMVILICQLNKDGTFAGPSRVLFDVDVRIHLNFNEKTGERKMSTINKNRMGSLGSIYYEFTDCDEVIKFYTPEEWEIMKNNVTLSEKVMNAILNYAKGYKNHDNYKSFKKEFNKNSQLIHNSHDEDITITSETLILMQELINKYFYEIKR